MKIKFQVLTYDYKESPPWHTINMLIKEYSSCYITEVETGGDDIGIVVSDGEITQADAQNIYDEIYG